MLGRDEPRERLQLLEEERLQVGVGAVLLELAREPAVHAVLDDDARSDREAAADVAHAEPALRHVADVALAQVPLPEREVHRDRVIEREFTNGVSRLDGSIGYTINDNFTIAADVSNILGKPFRNFRTTEDNFIFPRDVRYEERVYSIGIRARL